MLSALNTINYYSTARRFDSYDFSTLYISILYLIKEAYRVRDNMFLVVDNRGKAHWSDKPSRVHSLTEETLIAYVEYLVDNIYVCVGNRVYR